jgi:hypothetical protein
LADNSHRMATDNTNSPEGLNAHVTYDLFTNMLHQPMPSRGCCQSTC